MKKLLNTLYVTTPDVYLALDGENVVVKKRGSGGNADTDSQCRSNRCV